MYPPFATIGIRFNDCFFTEPARLADWIPPRFTGLFVILAGDPNWAPRPFQPVCLGEFGNNTSPAAWGRKGLYVSVFPMPFSTTSQRLALCNELIAAYNPVLQTKGIAAAPADMARRMDELEKRHHEHSAQVLLMLGNIHKHFEPLPVPERRRIGYQPESA